MPFGYILPMVLEEQAAMLLWEQIEPAVPDLHENRKSVQKAIDSMMHRLAEHIRRECREVLDKEERSVSDGN